MGRKCSLIVNLYVKERERMRERKGLSVDGKLSEYVRERERQLDVYLRCVCVCL